MAAVTFCTGPCLVTIWLYWTIRPGEPLAQAGAAAWVEIAYLHAIGPAIQIADAALLTRAFGRPLKAAGAFAALAIAYVAWIELAVAPLNAEPLGKVASGLPYLFLNDMEAGSRATFYILAALGGLAFLVVLHIVSRLAARPGRAGGGAAPAE